MPWPAMSLATACWSFVQKEQLTLSVRVAAGAGVPELVMTVRVTLTFGQVKVNLTAARG